VQSDDRVNDVLYSIKDSVNACERIPKKGNSGSQSKDLKMACMELLDVRAFGQVLV